MSGLTNIERNGFKEMLRDLPLTDLMSLSDTVTNKTWVGCAKDAVDAILLYSKNAEELFKRKKVHRELIFKYLVKQNIFIALTADKSQLVNKTLQFWRSRSMVSTASACTSLSTTQKKVVEKTDYSAVKTPVYSFAETPDYSAVKTPDYSAVKTSLYSAVKTPVYSFAETPDYSAVKTTDCSAVEITDCSAFGVEFCQWFFQVLNSQSLSFGQTPQDWGPQHFWEDAELKLHSLTDQEQMKEFHGAAPVSAYLLSLVREEKLLFSPNMESHGLKCEASPHGLVVVAVAGTVHRDQICMGIFEKVFGLIRSPLDNKWKIKHVHMKVRGQ